jgi:hypothetical protein
MIAREALTSNGDAAIAAPKGLAMTGVSRTWHVTGGRTCAAGHCEELSDEAIS